MGSAPGEAVLLDSTDGGLLTSPPNQENRIMLTDLEPDRRSVRMPVVRLRIKRGRLSIDIPRPHFETALKDFTNAAEHFAMHLSDALGRKFAYHYHNQAWRFEQARVLHLREPGFIARLDKLDGAAYW